VYSITIRLVQYSQQATTTAEQQKSRLCNDLWDVRNQITAANPAPTESSIESIVSERHRDAVSTQKDSLALN
jgi:hypothetical protein